MLCSSATVCHFGAKLSQAATAESRYFKSLLSEDEAEALVRCAIISSDLEQVI